MPSGQKEMKKRVDFLKTLPRKRNAVGVFLFNDKNELLVVELSYSKFWNIPGGCVDAGESLLDALHREIMEEIGISVEILKCIVVEDKIEEMDRYLDESLQFVFLGENLTKEKIEKIKIDNDEIIDFKFIKIPEALKILNPKMVKRIKLLKGDYGKCIFVKRGERVL